MSDGFEEWCHSMGMTNTRISSTHMVNISVLKECWDYQQSKIEDRENKIRSLESTFQNDQDNIQALKERVRELEEIKKDAKETNA